MASNGYRALARDRRGHGRSSQPRDCNHPDQDADDLAELIEKLDLRDVVLIGHSTCGGEVTRHIGRHGTARVAKAVLVDAIPPLMLKTNANPGGPPIEHAGRQITGIRRPPLTAPAAIPVPTEGGSSVSTQQRGGREALTSTFAAPRPPAAARRDP